MTRLASCFVALVAFSILSLGTCSVSEAAKKHAKPHHAAAKHHKKAKGEIQVTVVDHSGKPVAGAKVHLHKVVHHKKQSAASAGKHSHAAVAQHAAKAKAKPKSQHAHHRSGRTAVTDAEGKATFAHVRPGHHHVTAHKKSKGHGHRHVSIKGSENKAVKVRLGSKHSKHKSHAQAGKAAKPNHARVAPH